MDGTDSAFVLHELERRGRAGAQIAVADGAGAIGTFGVGSAPGGCPVREDSVFLIGSVGKAVTAAVVMQLCDLGVLDLDAPLATYGDSFRPADPAGDTLSLRHLLSHSSGIGDAAGAGVQTTVMEAARNALSQPMLFTPGTTTSVSSTGFVVAGAVVEKALGMPWHHVVEEAITRPLGLDTMTSDPRRLIGECVVSAVAPRDLPAHLPAWGAPAGATLFSTARDVAAFVHSALVSPEPPVPVMSPASRHTMTAPHVEVPTGDPHIAYGLGVRVAGGDVVYIPGASPSASVDVRVVDGTVSVTCVPGPSVERLADALWPRARLRHNAWDDFVPDPHQQEGSLARFAGCYLDSAQERLSVELCADQCWHLLLKASSEGAVEISEFWPTTEDGLFIARTYVPDEARLLRFVDGGDRLLLHLDERAWRRDG